MFLRFWASFHSGLEGQYWFQTNFRRGGNGLILGKTVTEKTCFLGILYVLKSREENSDIKELLGRGERGVNLRLEINSEENGVE